MFFTLLVSAILVSVFSQPVERILHASVPTPSSRGA